MQPKQSIPSSCQAAHAANLRALYQSWHSVPYPGALDETMRDCPVIEKENLPDALWGAVNQVDPEVRLRREEFSEDPIVKATQCLNVVYASLFELSYPPNVPHQWSLKLPGGHFLGKAPVYTATVKKKDQPQSLGTHYEIKHEVTKSAPEAAKISNNHFPPVGYTKGDEGDSIRALVGIAHYVTRLLETYPNEKLQPVARELGAWPVMLQRGDKSVDAAKAHLTDIQLGAASTIDVIRNGPDTDSNRVLVRELIDIHRYLLDPSRWEALREREQEVERGIAPPEESEALSREEWDAMPLREFVPFSKWRERAEAEFDSAATGQWKSHAILLPPLSRETAKNWWSVVWKKLVEERDDKVHLKPKQPWLEDLSSLCVDTAKTKMLTKLRLPSASKRPDEKTIKRLEAIDGKWCGPVAKELGLEGITIEASDAKNWLRRRLSSAYRRLFS
jgi:hypothetical protein